jgi:hypothetical protein
VHNKSLIPAAPRLARYNNENTSNGLSRLGSDNLPAVSGIGIPLKCGMDPTNSLRLGTVPSENGLRPAESLSNNLLDMACESPHAGKVKFMCSFGGKMLPRPSDGALRYVGGETRLISVARGFSWRELLQKTLRIYSQPHTIKYQLPDEDLDALISLSCEEDLQNMMEEYYNLEKANGSPRLRIFLVSLSECEDPPLDSRSLESEPEYQFVAAVNNIAQLNRSISGKNLMNQPGHQLDSSPLPYRDSHVCQTNTEIGAKSVVGTALNESSSQFFLSPCTQHVVAESSTSPSLSQQRTVKQSRMQVPADKSTLDQEHVNRSELSVGLNQKAMLPDHQDKKQNDEVGSHMHHPHIRKHAKDLARNESDLLPQTNHNISTPVEAPFEKVSMHPENAIWGYGLHEQPGQVLGMPHAFSDPFLKDHTELPASNLSLPAGSCISPSSSQKIRQTNEPEVTISGTRAAFECVKPPDVACSNDPNYLVSDHIDQWSGQGIVGPASSQLPVYYQHERLSSNVVQNVHVGGPAVKQDRPHHQESSAVFNYSTRVARLSSDELDVLESSVPAAMHATDHSLSYLLNGSQAENSNHVMHEEKPNSGFADTDYGATGYVHGNSKAAPEPHTQLLVNPSKDFTSQISMTNKGSDLTQKENLDQSSVGNSSLAASQHRGPSDAALGTSLYVKGAHCSSSSQNQVIGGVLRREDPLLNQPNTSCTEGVNGFDRTINDEKSKLTLKMPDDIQMDVHVVVEDVTDNVPSGIPSSRPVVPQVEEQQEVIISSQMDDDARSNEPEVASEG